MRPLRSQRQDRVPVIDLFAGPGGLGEGFSALEHAQINFDVAPSVEKDPAAHSTLLLRSFFRHLRSDRERQSYYLYLRGGLTADELFKACPVAFDEAKRRCLHLELGARTTNRVYGYMDRVVAGAKHWVLVGGPPCQAYSVVGRSRLAKMERTAFEENEKHVLYREYLRILALYKPAVFVMENVKGLLSATYAGNSTFERIISDLSSPTAAMRESMKRRTPQTRRGSDYTVLPLVQPSTTKPRPEDYLIAAENFGVPQRRHRVILLGVRSDLAVPSGASLRLSEAPAVRDVLADLPPLRSQLSKQTDGAAAWEWAIRQAMREFQPHDLDDAIAQTMSGAMGCLRSGAGSGGRSVAKTGRTALPSTALTEWIIDPGMDFVVNHETRKHIPEDLLRYLFVASYAVVNGAPVLPACRRLASTLACGRKGFRCRRVVRGRSLRRRVPWAALESAKTIRASGLATDSARVKRTHATSLAGG